MLANVGHSAGHSALHARLFWVALMSNAIICMAETAPHIVHANRDKVLMNEVTSDNLGAPRPNTLERSGKWHNWHNMFQFHPIS